MKIKVLLILSLTIALASAAFAATTNPSPASTGYTPVVLPIMSTYSGTATKTAVVKFTAPNGYKVVGANATARTASGTSPTLKVVGKSGTYVNYSGTVTAAGTTKALTVTSNRITDESAVTVDLVIGGTSTPTWSDITLMLLLKRL